MSGRLFAIFPRGIFFSLNETKIDLLIFYFQTTYAISCKTILITLSYLELALILDIKIHMKRSRLAIDFDFKCIFLYKI